MRDSRNDTRAANLAFERMHTGTAGYLSVGHMAQCVVHALRSQKIILFSMGPKLIGTVPGGTHVNML